VGNRSPGTLPAIKWTAQLAAGSVSLIAYGCFEETSIVCSASLTNVSPSGQFQTVALTSHFAGKQPLTRRRRLAIRSRRRALSQRTSAARPNPSGH